MLGRTMIGHIRERHATLVEEEDRIMVKAYHFIFIGCAVSVSVSNSGQEIYVPYSNSGWICLVHFHTMVWILPLRYGLNRCKHSRIRKTLNSKKLIWRWMGSIKRFCLRHTTAVIPAVHMVFLPLRSYLL